MDNNKLTSHVILSYNREQLIDFVADFEKHYHLLPRNIFLNDKDYNRLREFSNLNLFVVPNFNRVVRLLINIDNNLKESHILLA